MPTATTMAAAVGAPLIDWAYLALLFTRISPYFWCAMGIALCVGLSILGAAWCALLPSPDGRHNDSLMHGDPSCDPRPLPCAQASSDP